MTKTQITEQLHKALDKTHKIYTFNSRNPLPIGLKGLPDHLLINRTGTGLWWVEVKIGKDTEKPDQKIFREMIQKQEKKNKAIHYRQVTELNLGEVISEVYGK